MSGGRFQEPGLVQPQRLHPLDAGRVLHQRCGVLGERLPRCVPAHPELPGHLGGGPHMAAQLPEDLLRARAVVALGPSSADAQAGVKHLDRYDEGADDAAAGETDEVLDLEVDDGAFVVARPP